MVTPYDFIPVVPYADIGAAHAFLVAVLGFASGGLVEDGDGQIVHGEVRAGTQRIWLHAVNDDLGTPRSTGVRTGGIVVYVDDVDAHFRRVRTAGAAILREPTDQEYGLRDYGVSDPEGHSWWIATPLTTPD